MAKTPTPAPPAPQAGGAPLSVDRNQLAVLLNCDARSVNRYGEWGLLERLPGKPAGRYDMVRSVQKVVTHFREQASGRSNEGGVNPIEENALLRRAQREKVERERDLTIGASLTIDEVEDVTGEVITAIRQIALSIPELCAIEGPHLKNDDLALIKRVVNKALLTNSVVAMEGEKMAPELADRVRKRSGKDER